MTAMDRPETRYVTVGDGQVAYQVIGDGPHDLPCLWPGRSHRSTVARPAQQPCAGWPGFFLPAHHLDRRGTGASDRSLSPLSAWKELTEDMAAVVGVLVPLARRRLRIGGQNPALRNGRPTPTVSTPRGRRLPLIDTQPAIGTSGGSCRPSNGVSKRDPATAAVAMRRPTRVAYSRSAIGPS
jgi:hypothetical protein